MLQQIKEDLEELVVPLVLLDPLFKVAVGKKITPANNPVYKYFIQYNLDTIVEICFFVNDHYFLLFLLQQL